jgi:two-component system cell cycle sensor histidine kinase/response regulator CckA
VAAGVKQQQAGQLLRATLEATSDGILVVDGEGRIVLSNRRFSEMWGYSAELMAGGDDLVLRHQAKELVEDPVAFFEPIGRLYETREEHSDEILLKDGRLFERYSAPLLLGDSIAGRVWRFRDVTAYRSAVRSLEEGERQYRELVEGANSIVLRWDLDGIISFMNEYGQRLFGYTSEELIGHSIVGTIVADHESTGRDLIAMVEEIKANPDRFVHNENENTCKDGTPLWVAWSNKSVSDRAGRPAGILSIGNDITERKRLEQQLLQAQKMEAVGRVAGGIAHDFNNLLMVINGYCEIMLEGLPKNDPRSADVLQIKGATERAGALIRQLLAFSRRQISQPRVLELNALLVEMEPMVRRLVGSPVCLRMELSELPCRVYADPVNLEQVVLNLAVNARDAMPRGGELRLATEVRYEDGTSNPAYSMVKPARYVLWTVSDTGVGMSREAREHLFEPFFTTKEADKGTGLGLSTVYGIVKQSDGYIFMDSNPGSGARFVIFLPEVAEVRGRPTAAREVSLPSLRGDERILLVEDEPQVRRFTKTLLEKHGYSVFDSGDGTEALAMLKTLDGSVDLVVTDLVMPGMDGRQLRERIRREYPKLPTLFISGYSPDYLREQTGLEQPAEVVGKPFTSVELLRKIRSLLES